MQISKSVGKKLKLLRIEKELTQYQLADKLNVSKANISKYEHGDIEINFNTLVKICNFFDISLDWLFGIKHKKEIENMSFDNDFIEITKDIMDSGLTSDQIKKAIEFYKNIVDDIKKEP
jgi:transcriptional regulator with XRE-family HTH domain